MAKDNEDLIKRHPEVVNSGAKYFNISENRIPQEVVPRGDVRELKTNQYEITSSDILGLAIYAHGLINKELLETNKESALLDACLMAIRDKDAGRFESSVNSNTQGLILAAMESLTSKKVKEIAMSKEAAKEDKKVVKKEEAKVNPLGTGKTLGPGGQIKDKSKAQTQKELNALPVAVRQKLKAKKASISERLDKAAGSLEKEGNTKLAEQLDIVANTLDGITYG